MEVDLQTVTNFVAAYDTTLSTNMDEVKSVTVPVRDLGEALSYLAMCVIAQSGIDETDAPLLMQELGLGLINGAFEAGKIQPLPWYNHLTKEQAEFLEETTGVLTHEAN